MKTKRRKIIGAVLYAAVLFGALCLQAPRAAAAGLGDVNGDGAVTAADARTVLRAAVKLEDLADERFTAADVNGDGAVTAADARTVLRAAVHLAALNAEGTAFVDVLTPAEILADFLMREGVYTEEGIYAISFLDSDGFTDVFAYKPGEEFPFVVYHFSDVEENFDFFLYFDESFSEYGGTAMLSDDQWIYAAAGFTVDHQNMHLDYSANYITAWEYEGSPDYEEKLAFHVNIAAPYAMSCLLQVLQNEGVKITPEDMHLYHVMDV